MGNEDFPHGQRMSRDETLACCRHGTTRSGHTDIRDTSTGTWRLAPHPGQGSRGPCAGEFPCPRNPSLHPKSRNQKRFRNRDCLCWSLSFVFLVTS